jgi:hypothetical protein
MSASLTTDKKVTSIVRVTKGTPIDEGGGFDVARDGSRLVAILSPRDLPPPSLTVVLNWETLLK